jgi:hypothetical protein
MAKIEIRLVRGGRVAPGGARFKPPCSAETRLSRSSSYRDMGVADKICVKTYPTALEGLSTAGWRGCAFRNDRSGIDRHKTPRTNMWQWERDGSCFDHLYLACHNSIAGF